MNTEIVKGLNELIPQGAMYRSVGYRLFKDWCLELKKNLKRKKMPYPSANAFQKVVRRWTRTYDDNTISEASRIASKLIDYLRVNDDQFKLLK